MQKLLLLSVLISTFAIPVSLLKLDRGNEYELTLKRVAAFTAAYVVLLLFVYPRLF